MFISSHSFHKDTDNTPFSIIYTDKFRNIWGKKLKMYQGLSSRLYNSNFVV